MRFLDLLPPPPGEGWGGGAAAALLLAFSCATTLAAPFTPASDAEVVERLPGAGGDPAVRRVDSLRKQLAAKPDDTALRLELAHRYFELALAQGDPRYVGYAQSAIAPLAKTAGSNPRYWLVRGLVQQYSHDFAAALQSLARAHELDPQAADPIFWRAAVHMVRAEYDDALGECTRLVSLTHALMARGCTAYVQASTGQLKTVYEDLAKEVTAAGELPPAMSLWLQTRMAEMATRLQRWPEAEAHYKQALAAGITDQFLLASYADFLLRQKRPAEVLPLLANWERSDVLLLRLALAGRAGNDARAAGWTTQLRERLKDAERRGDKLHEQEAARFELDIENQPAKALALAQRNYQLQKEPRDAEVLMRTALAANQPQAAKPALQWLIAHKYEDPALAELANQLAAKGAMR